MRYQKIYVYAVYTACSAHVVTMMVTATAAQADSCVCRRESPARGVAAAAVQINHVRTSRWQLVYTCVRVYEHELCARVCKGGTGPSDAWRHGVYTHNGMW